MPNLDTLMLGARADQPARIVTNSKGFRNAIEFDYEVPKGVRRILFVGDSYVDGMRTDQERTIGYLLEQRLARDDPDGKTYQVLIAGNKNPANSWYYLQEHGRKFNPHIVILGVTLGNDLTWHNYKAGLIPEQTSDGETILFTGRPGSTGGPKQGLPSPARRGLYATERFRRAERYFHPNTAGAGVELGRVLAAGASHYGSAAEYETESIYSGFFRITGFVLHPCAFRSRGYVRRI